MLAVKKKCLQRRIETVQGGELRTEHGNRFHSAGPATTNARPPNFVLVRWTTRSPRADDRVRPSTQVEVDLCRRRPPLDDDDGPTNLLVTSLRLERTSYRFPDSLLVHVHGRADHSTILVLTNFLVVFITTFYWRLASKNLHVNQTRTGWILCRDPTRHDFVVMHVVFRFLLRIFVYTAKQACALKYNRPPKETII